MEDTYEENMIAKYGQRNWNRAKAVYKIRFNREPNLVMWLDSTEVQSIASTLEATEEESTLAVAADKPELPSHHWDVLVSRISDVFEGVRAEHLEVKDGSLVFYAEGQVLVAYGPGTWFTVSKTADSESK